MSLHHRTPNAGVVRRVARYARPYARYWPCSIGAKEFNPYFQYLWEYLVGGSLPTAISADHIPPASPFNPIFLLFSYRTALAVTVTTLVVDGKGINTSHSIPLD